MCSNRCLSTLGSAVMACLWLGCAGDSESSASDVALANSLGTLVASCRLPGQSGSPGMCADYYMNIELDQARASVEQACLQEGGDVLDACPRAGRVGACLIAGQSVQGISISGVGWGYAPGIKADLRAACFTEGYPFVYPDGSIESPFGGISFREYRPQAAYADLGDGTDAAVGDLDTDGGLSTAASGGFDPSAVAIPIAISIDGSSEAVFRW